ncbi:LIM zinc-binding domain-containing Nebulette-like [Poecilia reticulata]|uniref:LIM zinc-binding domain-containing Nebulette-like n=1 Tax=Poecilia reticulata TaxID=8081 RepID=UPI0007E9F17D|nr:PREDICTED: LIM zinc-binding domain-containing Nebulette-like [Poecilia reticulata]
MNPPCARCGKIVYPTEKVSCLDKNWHKGCFHCEVCKMTLNMKNYKGYDKKPYCNAHYPKTSFTIVTDTPENLRLRQQSELQSQVSRSRSDLQGVTFLPSFILDQNLWMEGVLLQAAVPPASSGGRCARRPYAVISQQADTRGQMSTQQDTL